MSVKNSKYSMEKATVICLCLAEGMNFKYACSFADISERTGYIWKEKHPEFVTMTEKAKSEAVRELVSRVKDKAPEKLLRHYEGYGEKTQVDHTSSDGSMTPRFTDEQIKKAAQAIIDAEEE